MKLAVILGLLFWLRNVWALVGGQVAGAIIDLVLSYWIRPYRPRLTWDFDKARELVQFGKWISLMGILGLLVTRADDMFISKYLGMTALGLYAFAYEIANLPATHVTHVVGKVSFPAYARLNDDSTRAEMKRVFFNVMKATLLITAPLSALIFLGIDSIVQHVVGAKWEPIVTLVRILIVAGFLRSIAALATGVFHGAGRPHLDFWMNLPRLVLLTVLIWPACAWRGLEGASYLVLLAVSSCLPIWYRGLNRILMVTFSDLTRESAIVFVVTSALFPCYWVSERLVPPTTALGFALQVACALLLWAGCLHLLGRTTRYRFFGEVRALGQALKKRPASA